ncbi:MAG: hypothetical protein Q8K75_11335 [Chlamydiales bacterium]|nr:hypothetical protein [Chlamydiales bacterium]
MGDMNVSPSFNFNYDKNMELSGPPKKAKSRIAFTSPTDSKIQFCQDIAAKPASKPNALTKRLFTYYKHTENNVDTYYRINKSSFSKGANISKKEIKSGILDQKSMQILLVSTTKYQEAKATADLEAQRQPPPAPEVQRQPAPEVQRQPSPEAQRQPPLALGGQRQPAPEAQKSEKQDNVEIREEKKIEPQAKASPQEVSHAPAPEPELKVEVAPIQAVQQVAVVNKVGPSEQQKVAFDKMSLDVFDKAPPAPGTGDIVVTGYVLGDGKGDFFHMRSMTNELTKQYPDRKVSLVAVSDEEHEGTLQPSRGKEDNTHIAYEGFMGSEVLVSPFNDIDPLEMVKNASLVVSGPVSIVGLYESVSDEMNKKGIAINEYDVNTNMHHLCGTVLQMGLSNEASGIMFKKSKNYSWDMIASERLKDVVFEKGETKLPDSKQAFLCYVQDAAHAYQFLNHTVSFSLNSEKKLDKDLDIVSPRADVKVTMSELQKKVNIEEWKKMGVGSVTVISYVNGKKVEETLKLSDSGKAVRFVNIEGLPSKDFKILTKLSGPLVACTGDKSVELAFRYGKVPYYASAGHKRKFSNAILNEIGNKIGMNSDLYKYFKLQQMLPGNKDYDPTILDDPKKLAEQAKQFAQILEKERSFNNVFHGTVNRNLYIQEQPQIKQLEEEVRQKYYNGEVSLEQAKSQLSNALRA